MIEASKHITVYRCTGCAPRKDGRVDPCFYTLHPYTAESEIIMPKRCPIRETRDDLTNWEIVSDD